MANYQRNRPFYKAVQWTGSNAQEFVDWINSVEPITLTTEIRDGVLHIKYPNTANGFWQIPMNYWLVSSETWGDEIPSPYGSTVSDEEFTVRFTLIPTG